MAEAEAKVASFTFNDIEYKVDDKIQFSHFDMGHYYRGNGTICSTADKFIGTIASVDGIEKRATIKLDEPLYEKKWKL